MRARHVLGMVNLCANSWSTVKWIGFGQQGPQAQSGHAKSSLSWIEIERKKDRFVVVSVVDDQALKEERFRCRHRVSRPEEGKDTLSVVGVGVAAEGDEGVIEEEDDEQQAESSSPSTVGFDRRL